MKSSLVGASRSDPRDIAGGFPGGQSEYVRVPFGEVNCLKVPAGVSGTSNNPAVCCGVLTLVVLDEQVLCERWNTSRKRHTNELA